MLQQSDYVSQQHVMSLTCGPGLLSVNKISPRADGAGYFFAAYLVLISSSLALTAIFRLLGSLFHNAAIANAASGFVLLMLIVNSGFIIVHDALPPWTVYFYWVSPFAYGIRALVVNEFTSPRWSNPSPNDPDVTQGEAALGLLDFYTERKWVWIGIAFNFGAFAVLTQLSAVLLRILRAPRRVAVLESKEQAQENLRCAPT